MTTQPLIFWNRNSRRNCLGTPKSAYWKLPQAMDHNSFWCVHHSWCSNPTVCSTHLRKINQNKPFEDLKPLSTRCVDVCSHVSSTCPFDSRFTSISYYCRFFTNECYYKKTGYDNIIWEMKTGS